MGGDPSVEIFQRAIDQNLFDFAGSQAFEISGFTAGGAGESDLDSPPDTTIAEAVTGLSAIDDYGLINGTSFTGDDDANLDLGTGGFVTVQLPDPVRPDRVVSTGSLNPNATNTIDQLDGNEIFIFDDGEMSGMTIELLQGTSGVTTGAPLVITVDDLLYNPDVPGASDDIFIALDLDRLVWSLGVGPDVAITQIRITDDGISRNGVSTCDRDQTPGRVDTSAEIDAIAVVTSLPSGQVPPSQS